LEKNSSAAYPALLLACIYFLYFGMFRYACVPFGDESGNIFNAYLLLKGEYATLDPYIWTYAMIAKFVCDDPLQIHLILRYFLSSASIVLIYYFLCSFRKLTEYRLLIVFVCMIWAGTSLHTSYAQYANVNIFAFLMVFLPVVMLCHRFTINRYLMLILASL